MLLIRFDVLHGLACATDSHFQPALCFEAAARRSGLALSRFIRHAAGRLAVVLRPHLDKRCCKGALFFYELIFCGDPRQGWIPGANIGVRIDAKPGHHGSRQLFIALRIDEFVI